MMDGMFRLDHVAGFTGVCVLVYTVLTLVYSSECMRGRKSLFQYYGYVLLTCATSLGVVASNNLVVFMVFWGVTALLLYLLVGMGVKKRAAQTAKKSFIIIGGTDSFMLLGLGILWYLAGRPGVMELRMDALGFEFNRRAVYVAFICLTSGALAKAGAMPFHTWVPDAAEDAPAPVSAFLPASLDKLLGIYLLFRLCTDVFVMRLSMNLLLMAIGSITIIAAVMMALIQHDLKRLLGYHAVSQVGYMVLGIGTGNPLGIAGGLFHMLNNTVYKSCLFLMSGAVEKRTGTTDLAKLGGLARAMPFTCTAFFVAALAISGVPPLNGFVSKWMVYQGIIATQADVSGVWIIWLCTAMFGSALTLASFMKAMNAAFLGQSSQEVQAKGDAIREVGPSMWGPGILLAAVCVVFGVGAFLLPLHYIILPSVGQGVEYLGQWRSLVGTGMILIGLAAGFVVFYAGAVSKARRVAPFVGGENLSEHAAMRVSGVDFYTTLQEVGPLRVIYRLADRKTFDVYDVGRAVTLTVSRVIGFFHNGVLPRYLAWCLVGMVVLFYMLSGA